MIEDYWGNFDTKKERVLVARKIKSLRFGERNVWQYYPAHRNLVMYENETGNLRPFLNYIRYLDHASILDIGAGSTSATAELSKSAMGKDIAFEATVLTRVYIFQSQYSKLEDDKIHITSAEVLRGVPSASFGGVMAVYSVGYSKSPELAVNSIDRVLISGGAFIGTFIGEKVDGEQNDLGLKKHLPFSLAFKRRGYDLGFKSEWDRYVLLAIKPGGKNVVKAEDLLNKMFSNTGGR